MESLTLNVSGMSCGHCVARVTKALEAMGGVTVERVDVGAATVAFDPTRTSPIEIAQAVTESGYEAQPAGLKSQTNP